MEQTIPSMTARWCMIFSNHGATTGAANTCGDLRRDGRIADNLLAGDGSDNRGADNNNDIFRALFLTGRRAAKQSTTRKGYASPAFFWVLGQWRPPQPPCDWYVPAECPSKGRQRPVARAHCVGLTPLPCAARLTITGPTRPGCVGARFFTKDKMPSDEKMYFFPLVILSSC
jgi:hypothetical protein